MLGSQNGLLIKIIITILAFYTFTFCRFHYIAPSFLLNSNWKLYSDGAVAVKSAIPGQYNNYSGIGLPGT